LTYLVMEYVPGHTLRDTIAEEAPMGPARALALLDPVLSALAAAHRAGLVHRDVKPENVLIANDGRVKVADFGLAKAVTAETQHTTTHGVLIGTVSYLAPELVIEQQSDARADVYAVGVMCFELLTGTKPHTGETPIAIAYRHVHHDVPAPSSLIPGIPDYVDAFVARATTRDPSLRPADAGVLLHHLHRVQLALRESMTSDPELVADLLPHTRTEADTTPEPVSSMWAGWAGHPDVIAADRSRGSVDSADPVHPANPADREQTSVLVGNPASARPPGPSGPAAPPRPPPDVAPAAQRRRRRPLVWAVLLALLLVAGGAGGYWFGWGRYTSAPRVVGLEQTAAEAKVDDAGLSSKVTEVYSETVEKGVVISTDPGPGERILPDGTLTLTVSQGPERYDLPDLRDTTLDEAKQRLEDVKMSIGRQVEKYSENVDKGKVIDSVPAYGSDQAKSLPVDTAIRLLISKGRQPIKVGNWVNKDAQDAVAALKKRGLVGEIVERKYDGDVAEGDVISQSPKNGKRFKGDTVELTVSKGPELVEVPSVRYSSRDDAVEKLENAGFRVKVERETIYLSGNVAWRTSPGSGSKARKGSTITLYVV
ncbi:MAG: PASTA domain-containing protein, partial [Nocardioidaceae bacterium]|nr:PASTA domain-containing protein [Nocardioidaceae bacterium]